MLDLIRLWSEALRLNFVKARHRWDIRRARHVLGTLPLAALGPAPCQSSLDSGRGGITRCQACRRFDQTRNYRLLCPSLLVIGNETRCASDAIDVRPYWGRALLILGIPLFALYLFAATACWINFRHQGLERLSWFDVALPLGWPAINEHRRVHFRDLTLDALARGDMRSASAALLTAAHTGHGPPSDNIALARLATFNGYHSLADDFHIANLGANPADSEKLSIAWHDDLLLSDRPARLSRLALSRLLAGGDREFWLRAFFESIRHEGIAHDLLQEFPDKLPNLGLRHALEARSALSRSELAQARRSLVAMEKDLSGEAAHRFAIQLKLDVDGPETKIPPDLIAQKPDLAYTLLRRSGRHAEAREALRPWLHEPRRRTAALASLIVEPDPVLAIEVIHLVLSAGEAAAPPDLAAAWLVAKRAARPEADRLALALAARAKPIPHSILNLDLTPCDRAPLGLAAAMLPLHRDIIYALRDANPAALISFQKTNRDPSPWIGLNKPSLIEVWP